MTALVHEAEQFADHARMHIGPLFGISPEEIFAELSTRLTDHPIASITTPAGTTHFNGVPLAEDGHDYLIPYLVHPHSGTNQGTAGFAAVLRDEIPTGPDKRVLLILDAEPIETVRTTSTDARTLPSLQWGSLLRRALGHTESTVLGAILSDSARLAPNAETINELVAMSQAPAQAGENLHRLGVYVRDPDAHKDPAARLKASARWRERLENWSAPDKDTRALVRAEYPAGDDARADRVIAAIGAFGIDFSSFTLDDLPEQKTSGRVSVATPPRTRGAAFASASRTIAVWVPDGDAFSLVLTGKAKSADRAHVTWSSGDETQATILSDTKELVVRLPASAAEDWYFGDVQINGAPTVRLAVCTIPGPWFPVESDLDINTQEGAFEVSGAPTVVCIDADSTPVGGGTVRGGELSDTAEIRPVERGSETSRIWLVDHAEDTDAATDPSSDPAGGDPTGDPTDDPTGDPDDNPGDGDPADGPQDPGTDPDDPDHTPDGDGTDPFPVRSEAAVAFALLHSARTVPANELKADFRVINGRGRITATQQMHLQDQKLDAPTGGSWDGLQLEAHVLANPTTLTWEIDQTGTSLLVPNTRLERLVLDDLDQPAVLAFLQARDVFFKAIASRGSVHAIGSGHASTEAADYVAAYGNLLGTVNRSGAYPAELDRLILCDSITDPLSDHIYIAPTNPVTVAFMLQLNECVQEWLPQASEMIPNDLRSISPRHLLPTIAQGKTWYESIAGDPLPWRHYQPRGSSSQETNGQHIYIARRIQHFLNVNPHYRDRRQTLSLVFFEPSSGDAVLKALQRVFAQYDRRNQDISTIPDFSVTVINTDRQEGALEAFLARSTTSPPPAESAAATRLMRDKVRVTTQPPGTEHEFAHIAFIFRSPLDRSQSQFDLAARSGTTWVSGLASSPGRLVVPGANETTFAWGTFTGHNPSGTLGKLVESTLNLVSGMPRDQMAPGKTRMPSTRTSSAFLEEVYAQSVWVVHLDRLLGLEAFTPKGGSSTAEKYLIDYEDRADPAQPGLDAITATKWIEPYRLTLRRALDTLGNPPDKALDRVLQLFNSVSGRWALDLVGANWNDLSERVSFAAAIAVVDALDEGFKAGPEVFAMMVPVKEMLDSLPRAVVAPLIGRRSDDLMHIAVDPTATPVHVTCRVIEVKLRTQTDSSAPVTARAQIETTTGWLSRTFNATGPTRGFRARDLAELIRGALTRAEAFGMLAVTRQHRDTLELALDRISRGEYVVRADYDVNGQRLAGDFFSLEPDNHVAIHRQDLPGPGTPLGYIRVGLPILEALATGNPVPTPNTWHPPSFTSRATLDQPDTSGSSGSAEPTQDSGTDADGGDETSGGDNAGRPDGQDPDGPTDPGGTPTNLPEPSADTDFADPDEPPPLNVPSPAETDADASTRDPEQPDAPGPTSGRPTWTEGSEEEVQQYAGKLDAAFARYSLSVEPFLTDLAQVGPSLIRFRTRAIGRLSITEVERRERDISREVGASGPVAIGDEPGYVTVDVPRSHRQTVLLDALLPELDSRHGKPGALNFVSGVAPSGEVRIADLSRLPHLLVAGATGSGKSVFLRGMLVELLRARTPEQLSLLIVDPKRLDFAPFARAPHLRPGRVVHDLDEALEILTQTLSEELGRRQPILERAGVSSAAEFYESGGTLEELPQHVILVDEFAELILGGTGGQAFSNLIQRYAQLTRAYGIFLVLATQRPSVDVITGSIKANLSARVAFSLPSGRDSMTVLDRPGAEDLLGDGDLLFYNAGRIERLQAPFVRPADVAAVLETRGQSADG